MIDLIVLSGALLFRCLYLFLFSHPSLSKCLHMGLCCVKATTVWPTNRLLRRFCRLRRSTVCGWSLHHHRRLAYAGEVRTLGPSCMLSMTRCTHVRGAAREASVASAVAQLSQTRGGYHHDAISAPRCSLHGEHESHGLRLKGQRWPREHE
jgi:hypothetical protein